MPLPPRRRQLRAEPWMFEHGQRARVHRSSATTSSRSRSPSPRARASPSTGTHVQWQKWSLRIGFTPREGLVLHEVGLRRPRHAAADHLPRRRWRRCSCPTATPRRRTGTRTSSTWASTASAGSANPLTLGCDCLGEIHYFDGIVNDQDGNAGHDPQRHLHARGGLRDRAGSTPTSAPRRSRSGGCGGWSISMIATVGNYEYGYFWYLYNDGTIEYEVKLTGVLSTGASTPARRPSTARSSRPACTAPHHQHFFCVRMDMAVDGAANTRRRGRLGHRCRSGPDNPTATPG